MRDLERHARSWRGRVIADTQEELVGIVVRAELRNGRILLTVRFADGDREVSVRRVAEPSTGGDELVLDDAHSRYKLGSLEQARRWRRTSTDEAGSNFALAVGLRARGPIKPAEELLAGEIREMLRDIFAEVRDAQVVVSRGESEVQPNDYVTLRVEAVILVPPPLVADRVDEIISRLTSMLEDEPERWAQLRQARFRTVGSGDFHLVGTFAGRRVELDGSVHFG